MIGYILILVFSIRLDLLPVQGYVSPFSDPLGAVLRLILPVATLSLVFMRSLPGWREAAFSRC